MRRPKKPYSRDPLNERIKGHLIAALIILGIAALIKGIVWVMGLF